MSAATRLRTVLLVEDNPSDARLVQEMLDDAPSITFRLVHVPRLCDALEHLNSQQVDVVLLDLSLPDAHGLEGVSRLHAAAPGLPIVIMSGNDDEMLTTAGVQAGAHNYLVKGSVESPELVRALHYAVERQRVTDHIAHLAHHDALTGLPNRALFQDRLTQALAQVRRHGGSVGLLFLDLDGFKAVNDTYGHDAGDVLLREIAGRFIQYVREEDTVARLGGDEFTIILPHVERHDDAAVVARRIIGRLAQPIAFPNGAVTVTTSVGIAISTPQTQTVEDLIKQADTAMYQAKKAGKNRYTVFQDTMIRALSSPDLQIQQVRAAIKQQALLMSYQPIVDVHSSLLCALEGHVAMSDGNGPSHDRLFALAVQSGVAPDLVAWLIDRALQQQALWAGDGLTIPLAVDLPIPAVLDPATPAVIAAALARYGVSPRLLILDIPGTVLLQDPARAEAALHRLAGLGVGLAIDRFDAGLSSVRRLRDLPVQLLKLEQSFVRELDLESPDALIVCAVIGLAHSLGLDVVADGVEHASTMDLLRSIGCDTAQGPAICQPLPASRALTWTAAQHAFSDHAAL